MARHRLLTLVAAVVGAAASAAIGCERVTLLEYELREGAFSAHVNDALLAAEGGQFSAGGLPMTEWLLPGANVVRIEFEGAKGVFSLKDYCEDGAGGAAISKITLGGRGKSKMTFAAPNAERRLYFEAEPTNDQGLMDAVAALRAAYANRDPDAFWALHAAMRADLELRGRSAAATEYKMKRVVAAAETAPEAVFDARPILNGRVWEVRDATGAPPLDVVVEIDGADYPLKTGSYRMRRDGVWSVFAP